MVGESLSKFMNHSNRNDVIGTTIVTAIIIVIALLYAFGK